MNMDYKYIEQLLERYWQCETSLEEESELRSFFSEEEVPAHLLRYKELFVYQTVQQEAGLGKDFDARISGSGSIRCYATENLTGGVSGSGNVAYKGNPQINFSKRGLQKL